MSSMFHHPSWQMSQEWCAGGKPIEGDDDKSLVTSTLLECVCGGGRRCKDPLTVRILRSFPRRHLKTHKWLIARSV